MLIKAPHVHWNVHHRLGATLESATAPITQKPTSRRGHFRGHHENVGADATVTLNGGTLPRFLLSGSSMTGTDQIFQGLATWTGGAISGAASTTFNNDVTISGANTKTIVGGRVINLNATTTWSGNTGNNNNAIRFWNGATINNTGTFNDANAFDSSSSITSLASTTSTTSGPQETVKTHHDRGSWCRLQ